MKQLEAGRTVAERANLSNEIACIRAELETSDAERIIRAETSLVELIQRLSNDPEVVDTYSGESAVETLSIARKNLQMNLVAEAISLLNQAQSGIR